MNRVFKRSKTGRVHKSVKQIHFSFDSKIYPAYEGDTIEAALYSNNLIPYGRTTNGDPLTSFGGLYKAAVMAMIDKKKQHVAIQDFLVSDGLELEQSNKISLKNKFLQLTKILNAKKDIPIPDKIIDYVSRIQDYFNPSDIAEKEINIEKNYIHQEIAIVGAGASGLYAALLCAEHGLNVVICDKEDISCLDYRIADKKYKDFIIGLKQEVLNHPRIMIKSFTEVRLSENNQLVGFEKPYAMSFKENKLQKLPLTLNIIQSKKIILATGLNEIGFIFQGHHYPNVLLARQFITLNSDFALEAGGKVVLYTSHDTAYDILCVDGVSPETVTAIIDTRSDFSPAMVYAEKAGYKVFSRGFITHTNKGSLIESVSFRFAKSDNEVITKTVSCDLLIHSAGFEHDISVGIEHPEAIKVSLTKTNLQTSEVTVKLDMSPQENILQIGYMMQDKPQRIQALSGVYNVCKTLLEKMDIEINPQIQYDFSVHAETYLPLINNYDSIQSIKKDNIHILRDIDYAEFNQTINRYEFPHDTIRWLKSADVFCKNLTACFMLLHRYTEVYNLNAEKYKSFFLEILKHYVFQNGFTPTQKVMKKITIPGFRHYHALKSITTHILNKNDMLMTPDTTLVGHELGNYYKDIINQAGVFISNNWIIIDFHGHDAVEFLERNFNKSLADLPLHCVRKLVLENEQGTIDIWHLNEKTYRMIGVVGLKIIHDIKENYYKQYHLHLAMFDVSHAIDKITLVGKKALAIFQTISKAFVIEKEKIQEIWIENILIHYYATTQYQQDTLEIFIISDASYGFYEKLISSPFHVYSFQHPILKIMALEAGSIQDFYAKTDIKNEETTQEISYALVIPVISYDELKKVEFHFVYTTDNVFTLSHVDNIDIPIGEVLEFIYSPYYKNYVGFIKIKGSFTEWQNKIITIINKNNNTSIKGKVISYQFQMLEEITS